MTQTEELVIKFSTATVTCAVSYIEEYKLRACGWRGDVYRIKTQHGSLLYESFSDASSKRPPTISGFSFSYDEKGSKKIYGETEEYEDEYGNSYESPDIVKIGDTDCLAKYFGMTSMSEKDIELLISEIKTELLISKIKFFQ